MKTWIDNTGLHSAGKLLLGTKNKTISDGLGFVQLATLIIFSDEIVFNGNEFKDVADRSEKIIKELNNGLDENIFKPLFDKPNYFNVVKETAIECAKQLPIINLYDVNTSFLRPDNLPENIIQDENSYLEIAIKSKSSSELDDLKEKYKNDEAAKIIHYMFADCKELRTSLKQVYLKNELNQSQLSHIHFYIRCCINQNLALKMKAKYIPSVERQQIMRSENDIIFKLDELIKKIVRKEKQPTNLPSFAIYLLNKSKGNPFKLIEESVKAREKAKLLRKKFTELISNENSLSDENKSIIEKEIEYLSIELKGELGMSRRSHILDALDYMPTIIPLPKFNKSNFKKWNQYYSKRKGITLLTEISEAMRSKEIEGEENFKKLLNFRIIK